MMMRASATYGPVLLVFALAACGGGGGPQPLETSRSVAATILGDATFGLRQITDDVMSEDRTRRRITVSGGGLPTEVYNLVYVENEGVGRWVPEGNEGAHIEMTINTELTGDYAAVHELIGGEVDDLRLYAFVSGVETTVSDLPVDAVATYSGDTEYVTRFDNGFIEAGVGTIEATADFTAGELDATFSRGDLDIQMNDVQITETGFANGQLGSDVVGFNVDGVANGQFYGPEADELGGSFVYRFQDVVSGDAPQSGEVLGVFFADKNP